MSQKETGNVLLELMSAMHDGQKSLYPDRTPTEMCEHPDIGMLIEALGYDFLIETLELEQDIFAAEYPQVSSVGMDARQSIKRMVNEHVQHCAQCQSEAEKDREWKRDFVQFLKIERKLVSDILKEKRSAPRGKPRSFIAIP